MGGFLPLVWLLLLVWVRGRFVAPAGEFLFVRDKKEPKSASADGCPAELAAFLRHSAQTAAGNMKEFLIEKGVL